MDKLEFEDTPENRAYFEKYSSDVFNDTATTEIYTLSLHDALPIYFPLLAYGTQYRFLTFRK